MALRTEAKDYLVGGLAFVPIALLWYLGWKYWRMRDVFLTAPVVLVMFLLMRRLPWWAQAVVVAVAAGVLFYLTKEEIKPLLSVSSSQFKELGLVVIIALGVDVILIGATVGAIAGGAIAGAIVGAIRNELIGGAIVGAIAGGVILGAIGVEAKAIIGGAIVGAIVGAIAGVIILGAIAEVIIEGAIEEIIAGGAIVGAIAGGVIAGGAIAGAIGGTIAGVIGGAIGGVIIGGAIGGVIIGEAIIGKEAKAIAGGAIVGAIVGAIAGAIAGGAIAGAIGGTIAGVIGGVIVGVIIGGAIEGGGATGGAIVGAIAGGVIAGGATIEEAIVGTIQKVVVFLGQHFSLFPLWIIIFTFLLALLILALLISEKQQEQELDTSDYPIFPILYSASVFPFIFYPLLKVISLPSTPWKVLALSFILYGFFFIITLLTLVIINKPYQYFLEASQYEKSRWQLISSYPYLLCKHHLTRAKKKRIALFYTDIHCRRDSCSHNDFFKVKQVIGLIGGQVKDIKFEDERLYVNLWFEKEKKARNADIDMLVVAESEDMRDEHQYDRAIDAVYNVLVNDRTRPRDYVKRIPVLIEGNPPLSIRAKRVLENEFGGIKS